MQDIILFTLVLWVAQSIHAESTEPGGYVYNFNKCNGFAQELSIEGDSDLTDYINPDLGNWMSANFTGGYVLLRYIEVISYNQKSLKLLITGGFFTQK